MPDLFPELRPYATSQLRVSDTHTLYLEECGTPGGLPVLFLHGGPGAGCEPMHRRFFDPLLWRIVLFDQRGSGRSRPHACLEQNTTWDLVQDIERIRERLGIERWVVFGGSWGSTLGLAYAQAHAHRVLGLVLRGIFLCRSAEISWFYQEGTSRLFPEAWAEFLEPIPEAERRDLLLAYHRRLTGSDELERLRCARAWALWEARTACLRPNPALEEHFGGASAALSLARIECHYFVHDAFLEPDQLLRDAHRLAGIPGTIVHGRYDVICPVDQAVALHHGWPDAKLQIVPDAGHAAGEPGIRRALVQAMMELAQRLR
jgi:proline iminopeptidase